MGRGLGKPVFRQRLPSLYFRQPGDKIRKREVQRQRSGHFVNVSSISGHKVRPTTAVYGATKHGVRAISEGLRQEVKPYNIRVSVISPGAVKSEL